MSDGTVDEALVLPTSFAQQRLWFLDQLAPNSLAYTIYKALLLTGPVQRAALEQSLNNIIQRHEALRTTFVVVDGQPMQSIAPRLHLSLQVIDATSTELEDLALQEARKPFNLAHGPLFRACLLRLDETTHVLLLTLHHIITDAWSMELLFHELAVFYSEATTHAANSVTALPELSIQYADYALWEQEWLQGDVLEEHLTYWRTHLKDAPALLDLPTDRPRPRIQTFNGAHLRSILPQSVVAKMQVLSQQEEVTLFMILLAAFQAVLMRYSGQEDIVVGIPFANRTQEELAHLIGFFANTLALRTHLSGELSFRQLVRQVREVTLEGYAHQELPFEKLVEDLQPERNMSYNPLVQVAFSFYESAQANPTLPGLTSRFLDNLTNKSAKFDIALLVMPALDQQRASTSEANHDGLMLEWEYNTDLFDASTIERMAQHYATLLENMLANPVQPLARVSLLTTAEQRRMLIEWNDTYTPYPRHDCIHQLVEAQAEQTPDAVAVSSEDTHLSYGELNLRANQLAHYLQTLAIGPDVLVGVCMERSIEMVIATLGILKAGGAYVPLDPTTPAERLAYMLYDTGASVLLTQEHLHLNLSPSSVQVIYLDHPEGAILSQTHDNPSSPVTPQHLAYVIYTSGSTGQPKGVQIAHHSLLNLVDWHQRAFHLTSQSRASHLAGVSFDAAVWEMWPYLACGTCLVLAPEQTRLAPAMLQAWLLTQQITHSFVPTPLAEPLLKLPWPDHEQSALRYLLTGGDRLHIFPPPDLPFTFYNNYGPTENTVVATSIVVPSRHDETATDAPSIGRPIANTHVYVLDTQLQPVPIGVPGELYIGGDGLARGYLHMPDLTAERFVPDPLGNKAGARLYRTGDKVYYRHDGSLEFLGRLDFQVKLRGFRVELGEIESLLKQHPSIEDAVVLARTYSSGDPRLVAYLVLKKSATATTNELRSFLKITLPEYMLPANFVFLDTLPLTAHDKVDRKALPEPQWEQQRQAYEAPRTPLEEVIAEICVQVLQVEQVGVHDSFFELGGHSLLATQVLARLREIFPVELSLRSFFEEPTVAELARHIEAARNIDQRLRALPIASISRVSQLPLSFAQERVWFLDQLTPGTSVYNIPIALRLDGTLNLVALEQCLNEILHRHETLRTTFTLVDGEPVQVITPSLHFSLPLVDLSPYPLHEREKEAVRLFKRAARQSFDLRQEVGSLFRVTVVRLSASEHILMVVTHHIVSDGWSLSIFYRELTALYQAFVADEPSPLPELPLQYADFATWQRNWLQGDVIENQLTYWREQLAGAQTILNLPTDRPRPALQTFSGAEYAITLPVQIATEIKALSRREGVTLFMTLLAAFQVLLLRYSGQEDIVVGTPIANRTRPELEPLIGLFVNTLALRVHLSGDLSFRDLLHQVREVTLGAYDHQDVPFEKVVEALQPERALSHSPLFQVLFALQNGLTETLKLPQLTAHLLDIELEVAKFDLSLFVWEKEEGLRLLVEYNTDLFDRPTIERLVGHYRCLLESFAARPEQYIRHAPLLTEAERQQILVEWNATQRPYPLHRCLHDLLEEQAARTPEAIALTFAQTSLSYAALHHRANRLAHYLHDHLQVPAGTPIALYLERSPLLLIALLAVLKAGCSYLPLDPDYPRERLAFMLHDAQVPVVLTQDSLHAQVPSDTLPSLCLDRQWPLIAHQPSTPLALPLSSESVAYLLYTSGSTGQPKGVQIPHRALVNFLWQMREHPGLHASDTLLGVTSLSFDIAGLELFLPLLVGARLLLASREVARDGQQLASLLTTSAASCLQATPATWRLLLEAGWAGSPHLRMLCGGEALPLELARQLLPRGAALWNLYGPTETTIWSTLSHVETTESSSISIGRPLANTQVYVLDALGQPVPVGVTGDLSIGGDGLSHGYWQRAELTAERFVPNPFSTTPGQRLYKTGDLARYRADGSLDFLGRGDSQVKLRGFRIELQEIEAVLVGHFQVHYAVVVIDEQPSGEKRLVAYVVPHHGQQPTLSVLRDHLRTQLPEYMIPSLLVLLDALPLTPNGKIDRRALPTPDLAQASRGDTTVAPRTPAEEMLTGIWISALGLQSINTHANFFELGGHSLLATQVFARVRDLFQVELPLRSLFEAPTIASLAERIEIVRQAGQRLQTPPLLPIARHQPLPLSFAQERVWFLDQLSPGTSVYNIPAAFRLTGQLNLSALIKSINEMLRRHETLRTTFSVVDGQPVQRIMPHLQLPLPIVDLHTLPLHERESEAQRLITLETEQPFVLNEDVAPLLRTTLLQINVNEHILLVNMHHIISDGWSLSIVYNELTTLYHAFAAGLPSPLPELPIQYVDFAAWQRNWLQGETLNRQLTYWRTQLTGAPSLLNLPTDRPRPAVQTFTGAISSAILPSSLLSDLTRVSQHEGVTLFMALLAAFQVLLLRYSGQEDIVVGTPIANRTHAEVERLIGFFVNTLALRVHLSGDLSFRDLLHQVREVTLGAYDHQDVPFEKVVEALQPERALSHSPLFQVLFSLQNMPPISSSSTDDTNLAIHTLDRYTATAKFDLSFFLSEEPNGLALVAEYNTDLFEPATIQRMLTHYSTLLTGIATNPDRRLAALPLLSESERQQMLVEWNATQRPYPHHRCLHDLLEEQAARTPEAIALTFAQTSLSYAALHHRANRLAHYLHDHLQVPAGTPIALYLERSPLLLIALLAVLKAGCSYLPLDPDYPRERLAFMLHDAQVPVVLTQDSLQTQVPSDTAHRLCLDRQWPLIAHQPSTPLALPLSSESLAYLLYTSGSTGQPKGVQIPHRALVNFLWQMREHPGLHASDTLLAVTSLSFDIAGLELFLPLLVGARLLLASREVARDGQQLASLLTTSAASCLQATPATWRLLLEAGWAGSPHLKLLCGGEALPLELARQLLPKGETLWNLYGPTETTIWSTLSHVETTESSSISIGRPLANTQVYILDALGQPVPMGVAGDLYIGGDGLSHGYWQRAELTADRFVPDPFSITPGQRLYKTGDLARYRADGSLDFLGRGDSQVKLRGFRIELGEIEAVLDQHPVIRESAVIVREDTPGDKRLVAYVVSQNHYQAKTPEPRWQDEQVTQWQTVWDSTYTRDASHYDPLFNLSGWRSSYTAEPIPAEEMREWVDTTVERILEGKHQRVLEIGCGTGLLLFKIAPQCSAYCATDFSPAVLHQVRREVQRRGLTQVTLLERAAHDLTTDDAGGTYDVIILNSVMQYFPSADYLVQVVKQAVPLLAPNGRIFFGDIRSLPLQEVFHTSVQLQQATTALSKKELRQLVEAHVNQEKELLIDPAFFVALKQHIPEANQVQIELKRGRFHNELTRFRYDVILSTGPEPPPAPPPFERDWLRDGMTLTAVQQMLVEAQPAALLITGVSNARLTAAVKANELLKNSDDADVEQLRRTVGHLSREASECDPEDFWALADQLPYTVNISWSEHYGPHSYDVLLVRRGVGIGGREDVGAGASCLSSSESVASPSVRHSVQKKGNPSTTDESAPTATSSMVGVPLADTLMGSASLPVGGLHEWSAYTNNPLREHVQQTLLDELRTYLKEKLPEYMLPAAFMMLPALPLTPNGKVDRRALPVPGHTRSGVQKTYEAPRTEVEEVLSRIWSQVLRVEQVGRQDNFFTLGGHSLLATQVISRVRQIFQVELPLHALFEAPTVAGMVAALSAYETTPGRIAAIARVRKKIEGMSRDEKQARLQATKTMKG